MQETVPSVQECPHRGRTRHTVRAQTQRRTGGKQRYGRRTEAASHVPPLLVCSPFTLGVWLADSPPGGHDLKV